MRISNDPSEFALNTSKSFGGATAGGLFGLFGDALADILRAKGIGPILKWVDDFIFFRIPRDEIAQYNEERENTRRIIENSGGRIQTGGRLWYKGQTLADTGTEQFAEDFIFPIRHIRNCRDEEITFPYGFEEIVEVTRPLGIPWESSKDVPFSSEIVFAGLMWNIEQKRVSLPDPKKAKYRQAISEWQQRRTHTLEETRKLYGKQIGRAHV